MFLDNAGAGRSRTYDHWCIDEKYIQGMYNEKLNADFVAS
jgi:hypothetical protein